MGTQSETRSAEETRIVRRMVAAFALALVLSGLLPIFAGSAGVIPIIVIAVVALFIGWGFFLKLWKLRRSRSRPRA